MPLGIVVVLPRIVLLLGSPQSGPPAGQHAAHGWRRGPPAARSADHVVADGGGTAAPLAAHGHNGVRTLRRAVVKPTKHRKRARNMDETRFAAAKPFFAGSRNVCAIFSLLPK
ncbi:MAG: hypothetical protein IRZ13_20995 [Acetobacteraceae bacterium]|nr:hypothetical protein [Acetobacteraceae bacterium]